MGGNGIIVNVCMGVVAVVALIAALVFRGKAKEKEKALRDALAQNKKLSEVTGEGSKDREIQELQNNMKFKDRTIEEQKETIQELQNNMKFKDGTIEEQKETIQKLQNKNAKLFENAEKLAANAEKLTECNIEMQGIIEFKDKMIAKQEETIQGLQEGNNRLINGINRLGKDIGIE